MNETTEVETRPLVEHDGFSRPEERALPTVQAPTNTTPMQMIAHAVQATGGGSNVEAMVGALEGWTFDAPKGSTTIRPGDHAMLQPMFQTKLVDSGGTLTPQLVKTLTPQDTAPPVKPFQ